jgi:hypothetical protein
VTIIVLEGPDLAGKSTLARRLADRLINVEMLRQGPPPSGVDILEHYLRPIQDWCYEEMLVRPRWLVLDRWHVGELIYGPLLRDKSQLTDQQADYIDMVLQTFGCNFTYVTQPPVILQERWDRRGDGMIKREWLADLYHEYTEWMDQRPHWDVYTENHFRFVGFGPAPLAGPYIGPAKPKVLLLGDKRNDPRFIFPFVPARATSGHWLMGAMHEADVNHMDVGIMNACEVDFNTLYLQWRRLGYPPVITLGRNAQKAWHHVGVAPESTYLNHPQYERRFHYTAMERYGKTIKDVMNDG